MTGLGLTVTLAKAAAQFQLASRFCGGDGNF
jgi:hypothetical protein